MNAAVLRKTLTDVHGNTLFGMALILARVVLFLVTSLIPSAVNAILLAANGLSATEEDVPEYFDRNLVEHGFARTKTRPALGHCGERPFGGGDKVGMSRTNNAE
ncbi:MAG: hypothetical protein ABGZ35_21500 [Planctomycetaceae bacterium]|jgi:hypothetical protein